MPQTSFALLTNTGRAKEAAALANATTIEITHIAIGNGATVPSGGETALYNEVARKTISGHGTVVGAENVAYFDCYLAAGDGPFTIREAGLYDSEGDLIAIAYYDPPINKPVPASGQTVEATVRLEVAFSNIATVVIKVDPAMQVALQRLTQLPWVAVLELGRNDPPAAPVPGDIYVIGSAPTGTWAGHAGKVAEYTIAGWALLAPRDGHGVGLPDGRVFERVSGVYVEKIALDAQSGKWLYAVAGGAANALTATLTPAPAALVAGMAIRLKIASANTDAATVNVNGLGVVALTRRDGSDLQPGDLAAGAIIGAVYDGAVFRIVSLGFAEVQRSVPDPTIYVRTDGSDANDGSENSPAKAKKTISAAIAQAQTQYNLAGRTLTIQLGVAGTYDTSIIIGLAGSCVIVGDVNNRAGFILTGTHGMQVSGAYITLRGVTLRYGAGAIQHNLHVGNASTVLLDKVTFTGEQGQSTWSHCFAPAGGNIIVTTEISIISDAYAALYASGGGAISLSTGAQVSFGSGINPSFVKATVYATAGGYVSLSGGSFQYSALGPRYRVELNGVINTSGGGANFIPGNAAGSAATGGQYV